MKIREEQVLMRRAKLERDKEQLTKTTCTFSKKHLSPTFPPFEDYSDDEEDNNNDVKEDEISMLHLLNKCCYLSCVFENSIGGSPSLDICQGSCNKKEISSCLQCDVIRKQQCV
jgi:hypothetical protein